MKLAIVVSIVWVQICCFRHAYCARYHRHPHRTTTQAAAVVRVTADGLRLQMSRNTPTPVGAVVRILLPLVAVFGDVSPGIAPGATASVTWLFLLQQCW